MWRRRKLGILTAVAVAAVVATASAYAATAASTRARSGSHVLDSTYSCRVRSSHYIDIDTSVHLPPFQGRPQPATMWLDTVDKFVKVPGQTAPERVPQLFFTDGKNSLRVDRAACSRSSRAAPLKSAGLASDGTITPSWRGRIDARCATSKRAKRVLVHFRIEITDGTPQSALVAFRNDDAKHRPLEFINWRPRKITVYLGNCVEMP